MTVFAKNMQLGTYDVPHLVGVPTLQPTGQANDYADVTTEIQGLTNQQYVDLQAEVAAGKVIFTDTGQPVVATPGLILQAATKVRNTADEPACAVLTPASPVYMDFGAQPVKRVAFSHPKGAFRVDVYGSIDVGTPDMSAKKWFYIDKFADGPDRTLSRMPKSIEAAMRDYLFVKIDQVSGAQPMQVQIVGTP